MSRYRTFFQRSAFAFLMVLTAGQKPIQAQEVRRSEPTWWFGATGAGNANFYRGTTQVLNGTEMSLAPFHKGSGIGFYAGLLAEYRPGPVWGAMLNVGYDDRRGAFDTAMSACNCPADLSISLAYLTVAPSLRVAPFSSGFFLFAGPRFGYNLSNSFTLRQEGKPGYIVEGKLENMRTTVVSGEIGLGVDLPLSSATSSTQVSFSPFVSFHPYFGQNPRSTESWNITTFRLGAAIKIGRGKVVPPLPPPVVLPPVMAREVTFAISAPTVISPPRRVRETFPLRNHVYFDAASKEIPGRYNRLTPSEAAGFSELQLHSVQTADLAGRSARQLAVYHNILNILGDRMRNQPGSTVSLIGASAQGPAGGNELAMSVKRYLMASFGISAARIMTEGRSKPSIPSERPGLTQDVALRRAEDRRVDIESTSPALLMQVGGPSDMLRPVQIMGDQQDAVDSKVTFTVTPATELLSAWSLEVTDSQAGLQVFGPFTRDRETIPARTILGSDTEGDYHVVMVGQTKEGRAVRKEGRVHLAVGQTPEPDVRRFSVLFDFDRSNTLKMYESFLATVVAPQIQSGGLVVIRGHTDVVGNDAYNKSLSQDRALDAERILRAALARAGTGGVTFQTRGFGEDTGLAPFDNRVPEGRFYNRTVIIDLLPRK